MGSQEGLGDQGTSIKGEMTTATDGKNGKIVSETTQTKASPAKRQWFSLSGVLQRFDAAREDMYSALFDYPELASWYPPPDAASFKRKDSVEEAKAARSS